MVQTVTLQGSLCKNRAMYDLYRRESFLLVPSFNSKIVIVVLFIPRAKPVTGFHQRLALSVFGFALLLVGLFFLFFR